MGSIFGFVSNDLREKMNILNNFLSNTDTCEHFKSVKRMIEHERDNNLLNENGYVSGSRTLLRLHRGLEFIHLFLTKLKDLKNEDNTATSCRDAYNATLAKYHGFLVRQGAKCAMITLPNREDLFKRVCGDLDNIQKQLEILPKTLDVAMQVHVRIENLYTKYDLHSLP